MSRKNRLTGQIFEKIKIIDIGAEGKAIAKIEEMILFIPFGAPGDVVDARIVKHKKNFLEGRIISFHERSNIRTDPFCEHFGICGGCKWQHIDYKEQVKFKQQQVIDNFQRIGKISYQFKTDPIIESPKIEFYRNKLEFSFSNKRWLSENEILQNEKIEDLEALGFHVPGFFDKIININKCWLQQEPSNEIRNAIRSFVISKGYSFFNIREKVGFLRNVIIKNNLAGDFMIILIVSEKDEKAIFSILDYLKKSFPQIKSLYYMINAKKNDSIDYLQPVLYKGDPYLKEDIDNLSFKIGPKSFFQTNSHQAKNLYKIAAEYADLDGSQVVYDLYTGTGTIANYVARKSKKVIGIEYIEDAVIDARENSKVNNIDNTFFVSGDMAEVLNEKLFEEYGRPDVVITDPPRAGMHSKVIEQLKKCGTRKIVYISCNPATQARDIDLMSDVFKVVSTNPVDMFPHTQHVENVALLERKENNE